MQAAAGSSALRFDGTSSWVDASNEDSFEQLVGLVFRTPQELFLSGSIVTGLQGVQPGQVYYLAAGGGLSDQVPASGYVVVLGKGIGEGVLLFDPQLPVEPQAFQAMRKGAAGATAAGW